MAIYLYSNSSGKTIEICKSMKEDKPESIEIDGEIYTRVYTIPNMIIDHNKPKTIGSLAEKNTEKMIKDGTLKTKKKEKPFWRKTDKVDLSLNNLSDKQKEKYIMTGKK